MGTTTRTWRPLPGHDGTWMLLGHGDSDPVNVRVLAHPWEIDQGFPEHVGNDPKLAAQMLIELLAFDLTDQEIGAFVRMLYGPAVDALRGRWTWTRRVMLARPRELSP